MPNTSVRAAAEGMPAKTATYTLDDLQSDVSNLHTLIDTTRYVLLDMEYGAGENRNHKLDRVAALVDIADKLAGQLVDLIEDNYRTIAPASGKKGGAS